MKKLKRLLIGAALFTMMSLLTACGSDNKNNAADETPIVEDDTMLDENVPEVTTVPEKDRNDAGVDGEYDGTVEYGTNGTMDGNMTGDMNGNTADSNMTGDANSNADNNAANNDDNTVTGELGNSVEDLGTGVGNAVEDVGNAVGDMLDGDNKDNSNNNGNDRS